MQVTLTIAHFFVEREFSSFDQAKDNKQTDFSKNNEIENLSKEKQYFGPKTLKYPHGNSSGQIIKLTKNIQHLKNNDQTNDNNILFNCKYFQLLPKQKTETRSGRTVTFQKTDFPPINNISMVLLALLTYIGFFVALQLGLLIQFVML